MSTRAIYQEIWRLLSQRQRRWGMFVMLVAIGNSLLETLVVAITAMFGSALFMPDSFLGRQRVHELCSALGSPEANLVLVSGLLALLGLLTRAAYTLGKTYLDARYSAWCYRTLSTLTFDQLLRRAYLWHVERNSAALVKALQEGMWHVHHLLILALNIGSDLLLLGSLVLLMAARAGLTCLAAFGLLAGAGLGLHRMLHHRMRSLAEAEYVENTAAVTIISQALHGIKDTLVLGRQQALLSAFAENRRALEGLRGISEVARVAPRLSIELLGFTGLVSVVALAPLSGATQTQIASTLAVLGVAFMRLMPAVNRLLSNLAHAASMLPGATHGLQLIDREAGAAPPEATGVPIENIEMRRVSFTYPGEAEPALRDVSFRLQRRQKLGLVGKSGGGKSTLADLIGGLLEPQAGEVLVNDRSLKGGMLAEYAGRVGYVLQDPFLLDATIAQNVAFQFESVESERVWECLQLAQIDEFVRGLPQGLDTSVGERGVRLSGGQAQRLAIARSLYNQPDVLILDEATSALDNLTEASFLETLEGLAQAHALVLIAHRLSTVRSCDSILVLEHGRVVGSGRHEELLRDCPAYQALVGSG